MSIATRLKVLSAAMAVAAGVILGTAVGHLAKRPVQADDPPPAAKKHARGRKARRDARVLKAVKSKQYGAWLRRVYKAITPPASWDSRTKGWVPPIEDQGQCGSCWDFSGTGMVNIAYATAGYPGGASAWVFSPQYTLDCGQNGGCGGDDNTTVLDSAKSKGLPLTKDYGTYTAREGRCKWSASMSLHKIDDWAYCDPSAEQGICDPGYIKAAIMLNGSVGCAVAAGNGWDSYSGGVYNGSGNREIDHDVILIGWDDAKSTTSGKTVWLMRNSWGASWGDQGYMWITEGADQIGTAAVWCSVHLPVPPPPGPTPPPGPGPGPTPPPPTPGQGWTGTISVYQGMITDVQSSPRKRREPDPSHGK